MTANGNAVNSGANNPPPGSVSELSMLGKYQIEKRIGAGGMGAVYLARDTSLKRVVALKVLPKDKADNPTLVKRFKAEAQAAAQLRHENIVAVYDSGEADGFLYIAMEYVEGQDLFEMVQRRGVTPVRRSIEIIKQVAAALQHAYEQNIVHRDIKPSNLLIRRDGVVKLTDLGLARSVDDTLETNITRAGTTVGTVDYMSPEQARNSKAADIRSDIYSLGCTWYQMLTGSPPYPDGSLTNKLQAHAVKPIPDPRDMNENVPEGVIAVLHRMMAKKPEDRYQTPAELIDDLSHSTLTRNAISREIFGDSDSDDSDYDDEDDAYDESGEMETRDDIPKAPKQPKGAVDKAPKNRKSNAKPATKRPTSEDTEDQEEVESSPTRRTRESHESSKSPQKKPKGQSANPDQESSRQPTRRVSTRAADDSDGEEAEPPAASSKTRSKTKSAEREDQSETESTSKSRSRERDRDSGADSSRAKSHKPLPPKREPVADEAKEKTSLVNRDIVLYSITILGIVSVIGGLGYLISSWGNNVGGTNPFATPEDNKAAIAQRQNTQPTPQEAPSDTSTEETKSPKVATPAVPQVNQPAFDIEVIPSWAGKELEPTGVPVLTVGPGVPSTKHFNDLADAINSAASTGAVIKLCGSGPFPLPLVEVTTSKRILIVPESPQDAPSVILKPLDGQMNAGLVVRDGSLEVRGVHWSMDRPLTPSANKFIEVTDGQLIVRNCSFTVQGTSAGTVTALSFGSRNDSINEPKMEPIILVDRTMIRGDGLTGLTIARANTDAVITDSLFVSGAAANLSLSGHLAAATNDTSIKPRRAIRIVRSTLASQTAAIDAVALLETGGKVPRTELLMLDSLCCTQGTAENSTILNAVKWPQLRSSTDSWLTKLKWFSKNSLYLGQDQLIDLGAEASFKVSDSSAWGRVWNAKHDVKQFQKLSFPEEPVSNWASALPSAFNTENLSFKEIVSSSGGLPGCHVSKLTIPDPTLQSRIAALSQRPRITYEELKPSDLAQARKVDLKKEDLGTVVNKGGLPDGTIFEVSGSGICSTTPVKIEGRSYHIIFRQTSDGQPLKLQPKVSEGKATEAEGLFTVVRGSLKLTNAVLEAGPAPKANSPRWLIYASDSNIRLIESRLTGPENDSPNHLGLINWSSVPPAAANGTHPQLVCRDCYFTTTGTGIRAAIGDGDVVLRNSIIAVRGNALDVHPIRSGSRLIGRVDLEHVSISATTSGIRVQAAPGDDVVLTEPLRMFVDSCAFVAPLPFKNNETTQSTLLTFSGPVLQQKQVEWWGTSNGVSKQIPVMIRVEESSSVSADQTGLPAWKKVWDKSNDIRLLTGDNGIYLASELPGKWKDLRASNFELHRTCLGAKWAAGMKPIGADVRHIEATTVAKKASTATSGSGTATNVKPTTPNTNVGGKKQVGF